MPSFDVRYPLFMTNTEALAVVVVVVCRTWTVAVDGILAVFQLN
jgi:hypothetical protein